MLHPRRGAFHASVAIAQTPSVKLVPVTLPKAQLPRANSVCWRLMSSQEKPVH